MNFKEYFFKEDLSDFVKKDAGKEALRFAKKLIPIGKGSYVGKAATKLKGWENVLKGGGVDDKKERGATEAVYKGGEALQKFFETERAKIKNSKNIQSAEDEARKYIGDSPFTIKHPTEGKKTYTGVDHYANVVLDHFKRYLVDKKYGEDDSARYTVNAFTQRTEPDQDKNVSLLRILKNNGLLYNAISNYIS